MADEDCDWDFFVSYTQADRSWAEWIAWILEENSYRVLVQVWDFVPGSNWTQHMQDGTAHAARTIAVLSDDYLKSVYSKPEWLAAWQQDPDGAQRKLIPIRVAECDRPGLLAAVVGFDLFGQPEPQATARLLEGVASAARGRAKPKCKPGFPGGRRAISAAVRFPGTLPGIWRVPARNPNFTGRDDELMAMKTGLSADSAVTVHSVSGLGGVGKTQLAFEYAYRFSSDYDVVWSIAAEASATILDHFAALATSLGLGPTDGTDELRAAVHDALRTAGGWLLIFDNADSVDDIGPWLPSGPVSAGAPGHVIITTRRRGFRALGSVLDLDVIDMGAAMRLLQTRVPDLEDDLAVSIADVLGRLPLGLEQAAAYLDRTQTPACEYLELLATRESTLLSGIASQVRDRSVATVWELSLDRIRDEDPAGRQILDICAYLAPEPIPLDLFTSNPDALPQPLCSAAADRLCFNHAVANVVDYSMARRSQSELQVHRLVQAAVRAGHHKLAGRSHDLHRPAATAMSEPVASPVPQRHPRAAGLAMLRAAAPADTDDPQHWQRWAVLLPHVLATVGFVDDSADADVAENTSWLLDRAGSYLQTRLEDITGDDALDWVRAHNESTLAELCDDRFEDVRREALEVLDTDSRIAYVVRRGEYLYNFWRDAANPRGQWRRIALDSYRTDSPDWDVLIDVGELSRADNETWVWAGATVLEPELNRALVSLSRGGSDAVVVREFDMLTREFVANGFELPEAKSRVSWEDPDTVLVGTDFGPDSLTASGYPRIVKRWRRGTPLTDAEKIFEGSRTDVSADGYTDRTPGFERTFLSRSTDFWNAERYELRGSELIRIEVPTDAASVSIHREWLLIDLRTDWSVGDTSYPAGSLLAANYDEFLTGTRKLQVIFEPDEHTCVHQYAWTRDRLLLVTLADVASRIEIVTPGSWQRESLSAIPGATSTVIVGADHTGDEFFLDTSGFDHPSRLVLGTDAGNLEQIKSAPAFFDAENLDVQQYFATSDDGTSIPYFVVRPGSADDPGPTLLSGYGGFEHSLTPGYSGVLGRLWLARGGTYALANIRGGGEYGPRWHTQAMRENRHLVYEDFASVARDLVRRGITTVRQLGAQGGSNGGLLMGVMLTRYPDLFGALVCDAPLLDMKRFHRLMAGASWVAEYGDPDDPDDWAFMAEFSPFQNISADAQYPALLITTSMRDDRVHPGHARKMTAALEAAGHRVRYYENMEGGHAGAADNEQLAFKYALANSFQWRLLGGSDSA